MQPRIYSAIERLVYIYLHPENFESMLIPSMICLMKLWTELFIELVEFYTVMYTVDLLYIIMNYTALMVISYIDLEYYNILDHGLKDELEGDEMSLPITNKKYKRVKH